MFSVCRYVLILILIINVACTVLLADPVTSRLGIVRRPTVAILTAIKRQSHANSAAHAMTDRILRLLQETGSDVTSSGSGGNDEATPLTYSSVTIEEQKEYDHNRNASLYKLQRTGAPTSNVDQNTCIPEAMK